MIFWSKKGWNHGSMDLESASIELTRILSAFSGLQFSLGEARLTAVWFGFTMTSEVIQSDTFLNTITTSQDALHVNGLAAIPDLLTRQRYIKEVDNTVWISTVVRTDSVGIATQIFLSAYRNKQSVKFKAKKLFHAAP